MLADPNVFPPTHESDTLSDIVSKKCDLNHGVVTKIPKYKWLRVLNELTLVDVSVVRHQRGTSHLYTGTMKQILGK